MIGGGKAIERRHIEDDRSVEDIVRSEGENTTSRTQNTDNAETKELRK